MSFIKNIIKLLGENGINIHCSLYDKKRIFDECYIGEVYGVMFDYVDCTQHDKPFVDRIKELEAEVSRLKNKGYNED